jgi:hypothetical protein
MDYTKHIAVIEKYNEIRNQKPHYMPDVLHDVGNGWSLEQANIQYLAQKFDMIDDKMKIKYETEEITVGNRKKEHRYINRDFKKAQRVAKDIMFKAFGRCTENDIISYMRTKQKEQHEPYMSLEDLRIYIRDHSLN